MLQRDTPGGASEKSPAEKPKDTAGDISLKGLHTFGDQGLRKELEALYINVEGTTTRHGLSTRRQELVQVRPQRELSTTQENQTCKPFLKRSLNLN